MQKSGVRKSGIFQVLRMIETAFSIVITFPFHFRNIEKNQPEEIKDLILNYIINEYLEDEETEITYDTLLITSGHIDSFSIVALVNQYIK
jgi:hypothetical protein